MSENLDIKNENKNKFTLFLKDNFKKIIIVIIITIIIFSFFIFFKISGENKDKLISEKYIQAGIYLTQNKKVESKKLFEEIIYEKNKFYSVLALNTILEKKLENDKNKIIEYFEIIEKLNYSSEKKDLINLKKALYLINNSEEEEGKKLLNRIIDSNSKLKNIAEEINKQ